MAYEYTTKRRVEFSDTDMAGIMHFSNFFRYMEYTEHEFLRSLGFSVHQQNEIEYVSWPRVEAACTYTKPLRFEDEVEIHLLVREKKDKSIAYDFIFYQLNADQREEAACGSLTSVCVRFDRKSGEMKAIAIPEGIDTKIQIAPETIREGKE